MKRDQDIVIMPLEWYLFGNIYTGSIDTFRYRLQPDKSSGTVKVSTYTVYAYSEADDIVETEFSLNEEGLEKAREWILSKHSDYLNKGGKAI